MDVVEVWEVVEVVVEVVEVVRPVDNRVDFRPRVRERNCSAVVRWV